MLCDVIVPSGWLPTIGRNGYLHVGQYGEWTKHVSRHDLHSFCLQHFNLTALVILSSKQIGQPKKE